MARLTTGMAAGSRWWISPTERVAELGSVHLRLLSVDIVGECAVIPWRSKATHKADASEELGDGSLRGEGRENYRLIPSKAPADIGRNCDRRPSPKTRDLPTTFEQRCGICHILAIFRRIL